MVGFLRLGYQPDRDLDSKLTRELLAGLQADSICPGWYRSFLREPDRLIFFLQNSYRHHYSNDLKFAGLSLAKQNIAHFVMQHIAN
jgi:hypothetical protein